MQNEKRVGTRVELRYIVLSIGYDVSKSSGGQLKVGVFYVRGGEAKQREESREFQVSSGCHISHFFQNSVQNNKFTIVFLLTDCYFEIFFVQCSIFKY